MRLEIRRVEIRNKFIMGFIAVIGIIVLLDYLVPLLGIAEEWKQLVATFCGIVAGVGIGVWISRAFTGNIRLLCEGAERISQGDLTRNIRLRHSIFPDETEDLATSFNLVVDSLRNLVGRIRGSSVKVSGSAQSLSATAEEMSASSHEIASAVEQISHGAESQAEMVERALRAIKDLASAVDLIAASANKLQLSADETAGVAQDGGTQVRKAMDSMKRVLGAVEQNGRLIVSFSEHVQKIGSIVDVITNIAQQTNLLALNATIEAARAGEYGRGFAVVADEVRKLADSTSESAAEISGLIGRLRDESGQVQGAMGEAIRLLDGGREAVDTTGEAFGKIIGTSQATQAKATGIAELTLQQSTDAEAVVRAIEEIARITEDNASGTEEVSAATEEQSASMEEMARAAQELSDLAESLLESVSSFNLSTTSPTAP